MTDILPIDSVLNERPLVRALGLVPYLPTLESMRRFTAERTADSADEIWLLQHPAVYTLGQAGRVTDLLQDHGIPVVKTERGGQITYHGPGQVVAYVLFDLKRRDLRVRDFVVRLEAAVIQTLARHGVAGVRKPGAPGVYVAFGDELQKVSALGLKVSKGCSYHGVSLNVAMDLEPFNWINVCGYPGQRCTDLASLGVPASPDQIAIELSIALTRALLAEGSHGASA